MRPEEYDDVLSKMSSVLYETKYGDDILNPSIAYTYNRTNTLCGTIYRIFVNNKDKEFADFLFVHECGHILYGHCKNLDAKMSLFLQEKIKIGFKNLAKLFGGESQKYFAIFQSALINIVMDFEVNSRLFSNADWEYMNKKLNEFHNTKGLSGLWPEDYDLPVGLTWNEYLNIILFDPKTLLSFFNKFRERKLWGKNWCQKSSYTEDEYNELKERAKKLSSEELKEFEKYAGEHNGSTFSPPNGLMAGCSKADAEPVTIDFITYSSMDELYNRISRTLKCKNSKKIQKDMLYNYNRRKVCSNVIVPKVLSEKRISNRKLYVLLDVSGSVDSKKVNDFCITFYKLHDDFKNIFFIAWDTKLVHEWKIGEPIGKIYGGGTKIANGISYVRKEYNPSRQDVFFVVSDFCDDLEEWEKQIKEMNSMNYAINWNPRINIKNPGFKKIFLCDN